MPEFDSTRGMRNSGNFLPGQEYERERGRNYNYANPREYRNQAARARPLRLVGPRTRAAVVPGIRALACVEDMI